MKEEFEKEVEKNKFYLEELFKDECSKVLKQSELKQQARKNFSHSIPSTKWISLTKIGYRPLDHVLLDETIAHLLFIYFVDEHHPSNSIYQKLKESEMQDFFFSKHTDTDKYCDIAISDFGYPE